MAPRTPDEADSRLPWHERPPVLATASVLGMLGLAALASSVIDMSDESTHPAVVQVAQTPAAPPAPRTPPSSAQPAPPPAEPPPASSVPNFAAGPTAEMEVVRPTPPAPAPFELPRWLRRLLHQGTS